MADASEGDTSTGTDGAAKPITMADLKALFAEELPKAVNAAVTNHTKRLKKDFDAQLAALKAPATADAEGDEEAEAKPDAKVTGPQVAKTQQEPAKPDPALLEMRKQIDALTKANAKAEEARKAAERSRVEEKAYGSVRSALTGKVIAGAEDDVLELLRARNRVHIDESGAVRLRGISKDEPEDGFDLDGGIAAFTKSDQAKFFVAPPNAGPANAKRSQAFGGPSNGANGTQPNGAADAFEAKHGPLAKSLL